MNQKKVEAAREAETEAARKDKERIVCGRARSQAARVVL
jgi:hypothetical protein